MKRFGEVLENVSLKKYNTYKIDANAKYLIFPNNLDDLVDLISYSKEEKLRYIILGNGSNVIFLNKEFDGVVINLKNLSNLEISGNQITAYAGVNLNLLVREAVSNQLGGLENLAGIPGTLGGAVIFNAGCYGSTISDYLVNVTYLEDGEIKVLDKNDCQFGYRDSIFKNNKNKIVISAKFELPNKNREEMLETIKINLEKRTTSQPLEYPNAGSVFKNPEGTSSGKLIEDLGLKGYHINDAYVSEKHANFIINKGNATGEDIVNLINYIKTEVKNNYDIDLKLEQEIIN